MKYLVLAAIRAFMKTIATGGRNDELELLGYAHESWNHSKGCFAGTNQGENIWSVTKRYAREAVRRKNPDETARLSLPRMDGKG